MRDQMKTVALYRFNETSLDSIVAKGFEDIGLAKRLDSCTSVFIKPNLVTDVEEYIRNGANTDTRLIEAVLRYLQGRGLQIMLGEAETGTKVKGRRLEYALERMGVTRLAEKYHFEIVNLTNDIPTIVNVPHGKKLKQISLGRSIIDADIIINMPKLKTHKYALLTCALKNMFGTIPDPQRIIYHQVLDSVIAELNTIYLPKTFVLTDAISCMEGNGPLYGNPVSMGLLMFSDSMYCNDCAACKLMKLDENRVGYLAKLHALLPEHDQNYIIEGDVTFFEMAKQFALPKPSLFVIIERRLMHHRWIVGILFSDWFRRNITYHFRKPLAMMRGGSYSWYVDNWEKRK
jgi:Uncharacterized conserved protein